MKRRSFLRGLLAAPAVILTPGLLMPVNPLMTFEKVLDWAPAPLVPAGGTINRAALREHLCLEDSTSPEDVERLLVAAGEGQILRTTSSRRPHEDRSEELSLRREHVHAAV